MGARFGRYSLTELREAFDDPKERDSRMEPRDATSESVGFADQEHGVGTGSRDAAKGSR
jgi:hypothetical protein